MPAKRPNLTRTILTLDEKSFQDLLSAAFTIQEHNDHLRQPGRAEAEPLSKSVCPHCGSLKTTEGSRCQRCGLDELRPGERLQHNWASMWLMSQEQDLGLDRSRESGEAAGKDVPATRRPQTQAARDSGGNGHAALPVARAAAQETTAEEKADTALDQVRVQSVLGKSVLESAVEKSALDHPAQDKAEAESAWPLQATEEFACEDLAPEDSNLAVQTFQLSASDDSFADEAATEARPDAAFYLSAGDLADDNDAGASPLLQRLADLRVTLRFHRADLYLGLAIFVAAVALLWPAAAAPRHPALSPWERTLVTIGIAEAPTPVAHFQGDPGVQVWVDPHTALYYCPGEEQYGKAADGRLSSQRDAQMDRFEPAGRLACE